MEDRQDSLWVKGFPLLIIVDKGPIILQICKCYMTICFIPETHTSPLYRQEPTRKTLTVGPWRSQGEGCCPPLCGGKPSYNCRLPQNLTSAEFSSLTRLMVYCWS